MAISLPTTDPHPLKVQLKAQGVRLWQLGKLLNVSESFLSVRFNGIRPMEPALESRLRQVLSELDSQPN